MVGPEVLDFMDTIIYGNFKEQKGISLKQRFQSKKNICFCLLHEKVEDSHFFAKIKKLPDVIILKRLKKKRIFRI